MIEVRTYTIDELVSLTGFTQRNIAYYIQQGLLPKVGRRGRKTRYPQLFVDRLQFIQRIRDLQDAGRLGSVTLPRIARVIWHLIERNGELPELDDNELQRLFEDESVPDERALGETVDGDPVVASFGKFGPYVRSSGGTASIDAEEFSTIDVAEALERIDEKAREKERQIIQEFEEEEIQVRDGRYGPYIKHRGMNVRVPSDADPTRLTAQECLALVEKRQAKVKRKSASARRNKLEKRLEARDMASKPSVREEYLGYKSFLLESDDPTYTSYRLGKSADSPDWLFQGATARKPHLDANKAIDEILDATEISRSFGLPALDLDALEVDMNVVRTVDQRLIGRHRVLPISKRDQTLYLGMVDPNDTQAIDDVTFQTGLSVKPVVVERDKLEERIAMIAEGVDMSMSALADRDLSFESDEPELMASEPEVSARIAGDSWDTPAGLERDCIEAKKLMDRIERYIRYQDSQRGRTTESWTRVPISEFIEISVKDLDPEDVGLLESLAEKFQSIFGVEPPSDESDVDDE